MVYEQKWKKGDLFKNIPQYINFIKVYICWFIVFFPFNDNITLSFLLSAYSVDRVSYDTPIAKSQFIGSIIK